MSSSSGAHNDVLFLGLDASTQALKASLLRADLSVDAELEVRFDRDLPQHGTKGGTLLGPEGSGVVYSPVMIVVEAMDMLFERIKAAGWPVGRIRGVSAAGQQHASVYWSYRARDLLNNVPADVTLATRLQSAFSRNEIPNWQDSSTLDECASIEQRVGGAERLAHLTGSKAHTRFTGPQILRFRTTQPAEYADTWRISLVSSFVTTLLTLDGQVKGIDESDACGMNMWDMSTPARGWSDEVLEAVAGSREEEKTALAEKLGKVESDGGRVVGYIGKWFVERYGFSSECIVCPGTGDNPATFLSFTLREREGLFSLGTSDTVLVSTSIYNPHPEFHAFFHPAQIVRPSRHDGQTAKALASHDVPSMRYFNMLVYKNGSLAREFVRDKHFDGSWDRFNQAVEDARPKTADDVPSKTGFWWLKPDIIPTNAEGVFKFVTDRASGKSELVDEFEASDDNAAAMLESQLLNYRSRSSAILRDASAAGSSEKKDEALARVFATGGAAANETICSMMADVLGCDVCKPVQFDAAAQAWRNANFNACSVAAAYKAGWAWTRHAASTEESRFESFDEFVKRQSEARSASRGTSSSTKADGAADVIEDGVAIVARPNNDRAEAYRKSVSWWAALERTALEQSQKTKERST